MGGVFDALIARLAFAQRRLRGAVCGNFGGEFGGALGHGALDRLLRRFELRLVAGACADMPEALSDGDEKKHVFEDDPAGVFRRAPEWRRQHSEHRLRPENAAHKMVRDGHGRGGDEDTPVAIEGQKRERTEDMEMRFDPAAGEMDEQRRRQHLAHGDDLARERRATARPRQRHRETGDHAAEQDGGPDVEMHRAAPALPGARRNPERNRDPREILKQHQPGEQPVGVAPPFLPALGEKFPGARGAGVVGGLIHG